MHFLVFLSQIHKCVLTFAILLQVHFNVVFIIVNFCRWLGSILACAIFAVAGLFFIRFSLNSSSIIKKWLQGGIDGFLANNKHQNNINGSVCFAQLTISSILCFCFIFHSFHFICFEMDLCVHIGVHAHASERIVNSGSADMGVLHTVINLWYFIEYLSSRLFSSLWYLSIHFSLCISCQMFERKTNSNVYTSTTTIIITANNNKTNTLIGYFSCSCHFLAGNVCISICRSLLSRHDRCLFLTLGLHGKNSGNNKRMYASGEFA